MDLPTLALAKAYSDKISFEIPTVKDVNLLDYGVDIISLVNAGGGMINVHDSTLGSLWEDIYSHDSLRLVIPDGVSGFDFIFSNTMRLIPKKELEDWENGMASFSGHIVMGKTVIDATLVICHNSLWGEVNFANRSTVFLVSLQPVSIPATTTEVTP